MVFYFGDGAEWIWNLVKEYCPNVVEIVDYMRTTSPLYNLAKVVKTWVKDNGPLLFDGNISEVASRIRGLGIYNPEATVLFDREVMYFEKHAARMRYIALDRETIRSEAALLRVSVNMLVKDVNKLQ